MTKAGCYPQNCGILALMVPQDYAKPERKSDSSLTALKAKLARGTAQADRGEFVEPDEVLEKIKALKRRRAAAKR